MLAHVHVPSLGGATEWLNSEQLCPAELRAWLAGRYAAVPIAAAISAIHMAPSNAGIP